MKPRHLLNASKPELTHQPRIHTVCPDDFRVKDDLQGVTNRSGLRTESRRPAARVRHVASAGIQLTGRSGRSSAREGGKQAKANARLKAILPLCIDQKSTPHAKNENWNVITGRSSVNRS
eukprot:SAG11_NODE_12310_length_709_cov_51.906557_1_plen_120_part_00